MSEINIYKDGERAFDPVRVKQFESTRNNTDYPLREDPLVMDAIVLAERAKALVEQANRKLNFTAEALGYNGRIVESDGKKYRVRSTAVTIKGGVLLDLRKLLPNGKDDKRQSPYPNLVDAWMLDENQEKALAGEKWLAEHPSWEKAVSRTSKGEE